MANSQQSPLHATLSLIVNSVNEVNLINFRAGSHMTFSSIFSPTSKTSISSSKMGSSEWQSLITPTYLKLRVNLFSGFWMCSLQLLFQRRPPNSKEIKFIFEKCPEIVFFPFCLYLLASVDNTKPRGATFLLSHYKRSQLPQKLKPCTITPSPNRKINVFQEIPHFAGMEKER